MRVLIDIRVCTLIYILCAGVHAGVPVSMMNLYKYTVKHTYILKIGLFKILDRVINIRFGGVSYLINSK